MQSNRDIAADLVRRNRYNTGGENTAEVDSAALIDSIARALTEAGTPEAQRNRYDRLDRVKRLGVIQAHPVKVAAYCVRDPETDEWGPPQFHMTYDNTVMGVMGEQAAKLFARFVTMTLEGDPRTATSPIAPDGQNT